jgi:hypothetical protein
MMKRDFILKHTGYELPAAPEGIVKGVASLLPSYSGVIHKGEFYRGGMAFEQNPRVIMVGDYTEREPSEEDTFAVRRAMHEILGKDQRPQAIDFQDNTRLHEMRHDLAILLRFPNDNDVLPKKLRKVA